MNTPNHTTPGYCLPIHPVAHLFPVMNDDEFEQFKEDIREHGQQIPILVQNGQLIDGRHRYRACCELGIEPKIEEVAAGQSIERLVVSLNHHRRHLSDSQRAMIAGRLANIGLGGNQHTGGVSQQQAAEDLHVSVASVQRAKSVLKNGADELIQAVDAGQIDVSNAAEIAKLPQPSQRKVLSVIDADILKQAKAIRQVLTDERRKQRLAEIEAKRANNKPLDPTMGQYSVILADPPWDYMGEMAVGYPTMTPDEICAMPVSDLATEDAVLFLWCSASLMQEALDVIKAWGFTFKTQAIWNKVHAGMGSYFRIQHEHLMIATRGNIPEVPYGARVPSLFEEPRREHSRKPDCAYEMIEAMYGELNKIELFCRTPRNGWAAWGNECGNGEIVQAGVEVVVDTNAMPEPANDGGDPPRRRGRPRKVIA
ncbi:MT-A70 family methyltransferase [Burkholderia multivorans]|uniref:MT-A70 family methyltransferase n=1 Tax=Burkholderia multivorans TaxID=87883 RepID=UPI0021BE1002|nr:MT-A70 family methyltransferase [Burkholderia multivorans]MDN8089939.1 MT-A70 family methyltransferase [Burkholderia multivorans]MDN8095812.1 MT-A70 family methyltransferase [Burkholderia multivorans]MDN8106785.1 MT-A70 family methyltransferase [Burkholderia multivorans]MDN8128718.1 MT-A70 family methyltransferase [Burkholderia multivorans]MDN8134011.1 MT-A70 family methyltransferase [Burkholderia multivorans]